MTKQNDWIETEMQLMKEEYQKLQMSKKQFEKLELTMKEAKMEHTKLHRKSIIAKFSAAAALIAGLIVLPNISAATAHAMEQIPVIGQLVDVVTFRDYKYKSERNTADVKIPELKVGDHAKDSNATEKLERTTTEINAEIQKITDKLIKEFKSNLKNDGGYQDIAVDSEILATTDDYFTLKLNCYQAAGSGYQFNHYYTIDLNTGERLHLKDIFKEGADYVTPISENIKKQMKEQMKADENVIYWLGSEVNEWDFKTIPEDPSFYMDEKGQVVISFNEGDVAPMYMGVVEFTIPADVFMEYENKDK